MPHLMTVPQRQAPVNFLQVSLSEIPSDQRPPTVLESCLNDPAARDVTASFSRPSELPGEPNMQTIEVNGSEMGSGQGEPLVCIHSTLGDFLTWNAVLGTAVEEVPCDCGQPSPLFSER